MTARERQAEVLYGIKLYHGSKPYLAGTYSWKLVTPEGKLLADGEGCLSRAEAAETAAQCAKKEFGIDV